MSDTLTKSAATVTVSCKTIVPVDIAAAYKSVDINKTTRTVFVSCLDLCAAYNKPTSLWTTSKQPFGLKQ